MLDTPLLGKQAARLKYYGTTDTGSPALLNTETWSPQPPDWWKQCVATEFPYYADEKELPRPLPSMSEMEGLKGTEFDLNAGEVLWAKSLMFNVGGVFAVKISVMPAVLQEAENMLFVSKYSKVRVPKVYAAYEHQGGDPYGLLKKYPLDFPDRASLPPYFYMVSELIPGLSAAHRRWIKYSEKKKRNILRKLGDEARLLRAIPQASEKPYYGRIYHQPWMRESERVEFADGDHKSNKGPYYSHESLVNAMFETSIAYSARQSCDDHNTYSPRERLYLESFREIMSRAAGQEPVLSHLDLSLHNVIVTDTDDEDNPDICIVDWEFMAFVPGYWDGAHLIRIQNGDLNRLYLYEMMKDITPSYLDTARYFYEFCEATPG